MSINFRRGLTIERQKENAIDCKINPQNPTDLNDKVICITGTIPGFSREQAEKFLKSQFPRISFSNTLTKNVDYLITGFGCGQTKLTRAKSYRVTVLDSTKFFN